MSFDGSPPRVRRVPPPPPPGFGDEEYYRLYGRPENYHRYRRKLEQRLRQARSPSRSPTYSHSIRPQESYHHHRLFKSGHHPQSSFYYSDQMGLDRRSRLPPENDLTLHSLSVPAGDLTPEEPLNTRYSNFRVTIRNESEGTPSLSGMEDEDGGYDEGDEDDEEEEPTDQGEEDEVELTDDQDVYSEDESLSDDDGPLTKSSHQTRPRREISVKERLGRRPSRSSSTRTKTNGRHRHQRRQSRSSRQRSGSSAKHGSSLVRRRGDRSLESNDDDRGSTKTRPEESSKKRRRKKRRKEKSSRADKEPSSLSRRMENTNKENEQMLKRIARKRRYHPDTSESDRNMTLARLAGIQIPQEATAGVASGIVKSLKSSTEKSKSGWKKKRVSDKRLSNSPPRSRSHTIHQSSSKSKSQRPQRPISDRVKVSGMESTSFNSRRSRILLSRSRSHSPVRISRKRRSKSSDSAEHKSSTRSCRQKSPDRWQHDKFHEGLTVSDSKGTDRNSFGSHWSRIRSERSKERERERRSPSSSDRSPSSRKRRRDSRSSSSVSRSRGRKPRRPKRSYSSCSKSSRSSDYSDSSSSSGSVRRQRRQHKAERAAAATSASASSRALVLAASEAGRSSCKNAEASSQVQADLPSKSKSHCAEGKDDGGVNMAVSGRLAQDTNTVNGVLLKYSEPSEARKPKIKWRLYVFKGDEELPILYIHRQSAYLLGRDRKVADIPLDHPSCSKQHAVLQYRLIDHVREDGTTGRRVTPYVIDLESANGTFINNQKIEPRKYVQLMEKDILKFGFSSREYVLLHDQSKEAEEAEDVGLE